MALISVAREDPITRFHWKIETVGGLSLLMLAIDFGIVSFALAQLIEVWGLTPSHLSIIAVATAVGMFLGGLFLGSAADRIGRRSTLALSLLIMSVGTALGAISWDYISLSVFQFIAGFGMGGTTPAASTLIGEFAPAKHRGRLSTLLELFWTSGSMLAALGSLFILPSFGWRLIFAFGAIPLIWAFMQMRFTPESPRYLIARGKHEEARRFLEKIKDSSGVSYDHLSTQPVHRSKGALANFAELWSKALVRRTVCVWVLWFVLVYSYNGIFVWLPSLLSTGGLEMMRTIQYMLVFTGAQFPAIIVAAFLVDVIGRKWVLVPALFVCGVAAYMFGKASSPGEFLFWGAIVSLTNSTGYGIMLGYTVELFPTRLRGTGAGSASAFGRVAGILVPGVMALLIGSWTSGREVVFIMFSAVLLLGALAVAILGEETKGRTLEEIAT